MRLSIELTYLSRQHGELARLREELFHLGVGGREVEDLLDGERRVHRGVQVLDVGHLDRLLPVGEEVLDEVDRDVLVRREVVADFDGEQAGTGRGAESAALGRDKGGRGTHSLASAAGV